MKSLSDKIEVVGFGKSIEFKDKDGNRLVFSGSKGAKGLKVRDIKKSIKELKGELRNKSDDARMVTIKEAEDTIEKVFGKDLI